jgi:hypothetical protein
MAYRRYNLNLAILGEKQRYFGGGTTLIYRQNAKKYRYFEGGKSLIWGRNNAILVEKQCYYLYRMPKTTSLFWGRTLAILRVKQRYFEG